MVTPGKLTRLTRAPFLTRKRIVFALLVAVVADGVQLGLNFFGSFGLDQIIDVVAMVLTTWALGFHILLLPTFIVEFIPLVDMLPTWTACVIAVIALRKKAQHAAELKTVVVPPPPT